MRSLIVYAPNVASGGGLVLLKALLQAGWPETRLIAILDRRGREQIKPNAGRFECHWFESSMRGRWQAELALSRAAAPRDIVLCFHNLPPVLSNKGRIFCYMHNANLVGLIPTSHLDGWVRLRYAVERRISRQFRGRVERYVVQTPTMAAALADWYGPGVPPIDILPFVGELARDATDRVALAMPQSVVAPTKHSKWDFIYVSDGSIHKNHRRLFDAWRRLAEDGVYPSLAVTLRFDRDAALCRELDELVAVSSVRIENLGHIPHVDLLGAYRSAGALIFPSFAESFGIPLIEAQSAGLPILAPELDYVRDVCAPAVTFDAFSDRSIARAVLRFLRRDADQVAPMDANEFMAALRERAES